MKSQVILGLSLAHFLLIIYLPYLCESQRNEREEKICQPFLTSKYTSPLIANLTRNLRTDEEGEFSCELVLQDRYLPAQIRFTIHEGLYMLAVRHIAMGNSEIDVITKSNKSFYILYPMNRIATPNNGSAPCKDAGYNAS